MPHLILSIGFMCGSIAWSAVCRGLGMNKKMFIKCSKCGDVSESAKMAESYYVCGSCGNYEPLFYDTRIHFLVDKDSFVETNGNMGFKNPIHFPEYDAKYIKAATQTSLKEGIITGKARIDDEEVMLGIMDPRFIMGSMGIVVGEKITRVFETAQQEKLPVILFSASGGARMQEGIYSLMQMAKTTAAVTDFQNDGGLFISYLTNPTMGGVTASFALLGDINIAEPRALIGFAGPRVIQQTIRQNLPEGFQTAEFLLEHGYLDDIVERCNMRSYITKILKLHKNPERQYKEVM